MELLKKKPLTPEQKAFLNKIAWRLTQGWTTKEQIMQEFKLGDRKARDCISAIAKVIPIISLSNGKGYKRAIDYRDFDLVISARNELNSRIRELELRRNCLNNFLRKFVDAEMRGESLWQKEECSPSRL